MTSFSLAAQREFTEKLKEELRMASAIAEAVPHVRDPPWVRHESAKTVFRDVDLKELASGRDEKWRQKVEGKKLPPILAKRVAGTLTFEEGPIGGSQAAHDSAGAAGAGLTSGGGTSSRKNVSFLAGGDATASSAAAGEGGQEAKEEVAEVAVRDAAKAAKLRGRKIIRFKYTFRPPPWVLPKGVKRPIDVKAAREAGVRNIGGRKFPLAPAHQRYIESLEESVTALATEVAVRKRVLLKKIDEYLATRWEPPLQDSSATSAAIEGGGGGDAPASSPSHGRKGGGKGNPADDSDYEVSSSDDEHTKAMAGLVTSQTATAR